VIDWSTLEKEKIKEVVEDIVDTVVENILYFCYNIYDGPPCECVSHHNPEHTSRGFYDAAHGYLGGVFDDYTPEDVESMPDDVYEMARKLFAEKMKKAYSDLCEGVEQSACCGSCE